MKHLILFFALLLMTPMVSATTLDQDLEGIKAKAKELTKKYQAELGLDTDQATKFEQTLTRYMTKRAKTKNINVAEDDKKVMIKQLNIQENEDMAALLSKAQYKKYSKLKIKLQP